ncbi:MAG: hypothetical protein BV459_03225 [Thermoplasmata archaeon M11B2D]|nr:MAG: hypothetical protein BV459_03225 [Thermoplasmata archaeon M11B2D]
MFDEAMYLAAIAHNGSVDLGGAPYILHPIRVAASLLVVWPYDYELAAIGLLHDVVEDTNMTFEDLEKIGFSPRVVDALRALTHKKGVPYDAYIDDLIATKNWSAIAVKLADLKDNANLSRLGNNVGAADIKRTEKYIRAIAKIEALDIVDM